MESVVALNVSATASQRHIECRPDCKQGDQNGIGKVEIVRNSLLK